jgi:hypothetical protein
MVGAVPIPGTRDVSASRAPFDVSKSGGGGGVVVVALGRRCGWGCRVWLDVAVCIVCL